jgi:tetratricopeptide (TPR) repeat protein
MPLTAHFDQRTHKNDVQQVHGLKTVMTQARTDSRGEALEHEGFRLLEQWRLAEAEAVLLEALVVNEATQEESKRLAHAANIQEGLGTLYLRTGRWEDAVRCRKVSLKNTRRRSELDGVDINFAIELIGRYKDLGTAYLEWARHSRNSAKSILLMTAAQLRFQRAIRGISPLVLGAEGAPVSEAYALHRLRAELHQEVARVYHHRGFVPEAFRQYDQAIGFFRKCQDEAKVAECWVETADLKLDLGDLAEAERLLQKAEGVEGAPDLASRFARLRAAQAASADSPIEQMHLLRDGLRHAVRALLDLDEYRLDLRTEQDRLTWRSEVASPVTELAFSLAERVGDPRAMADLITVSRMSGVLALAGADISNAGPGLPDLHADGSGEDAACSSGSTGDSGGSLIAGSGNLIGLGLDALFRRRPVPPLRMPDGRIALGTFTDGLPAPNEVIRYA